MNFIFAVWNSTVIFFHEWGNLCDNCSYLPFSCWILNLVFQQPANISFCVFSARKCGLTCEAWRHYNSCRYHCWKPGYILMWWKDSLQVYLLTYLLYLNDERLVLKTDMNKPVRYCPSELILLLHVDIIKACCSYSRTLIFLKLNLKM